MSRHCLISKPWRLTRLAIGLVFVSLSPTLAQENSGVRISFSDTNDIPVQVSTQSRVFQSSFQESDFAPKANNVRLDAPNSRQTQEKEPLRESDKPVEPPTFNLNDPEENEPKDVEARGIQDTKSRGSDSYQLPRLGDVRAPIPSVPLMGITQSDPSGLLATDQFPNHGNGVVDRYSNYSSLNSAPAQQKFKTWKAHNFYHRPTYFENNNLARYGNERAFQNVASGVRFFLAIPTIPYRVAEQHPSSRIYTYGNNRPGDCTPFQIEGRVPSRRGAQQSVVGLGLLMP